MTALGGEFQSAPFASDGVFRSALEASPDGVQILDLSGSIQFVNRNGVALLGRPDAADLMGRDWLSLWRQADRAAASATLRAAAETPGPQRFTARLKSSSGEARHVDSVVCALRDGEDRPAALLVTSRDVTELEAARRAAEIRERRAELNAAVLKTAAEMAKVGGWEIDYRRDVLVHSEEVVRLLGGGPREQPLENGLSIYDPADRPLVSALMARARATGERVRFESPYTRVDGTRGWLRSYGEAIYEDGVCIAIRGAAMDISEEKSAEESLRRAEERLQLAAQLSGLRVYELDLVAGTMSHEGSMDPLLETEPTFAAVWPDAAGLVDPRDRDSFETVWQETLTTGEPLRCEVRVNRSDNLERWGYVIAELQRDAAGTPTRLLVAVMDITERKLAEQAMERTMAAMREHEARQKLLLDEVNHRVKNTLAAVQSVAAQTLRDTDEPVDARNLFLDRLMALSTTHNLLVKQAWQGATLHDLAEATLRPYGQPYAIAGPDLSLDPNYAVSVGMALHELATNALKHGAWSGGGRVDLSVRLHDAGEASILWRESGGPPVAAPSRRGFGSRLLERGVARELGARVTLDFRPEGLVCELRAPLSARLRVMEAEG